MKKLIGLTRLTLPRFSLFIPLRALVTAYHSPDGKTDNLEQNSITFILVLFGLATLYPAIALWKIL